MLFTLDEIRDNVAFTTREAQINSIIDSYINLTLQEINDPAWAFEQIGIRGYNHLWTFLRRKNTFSTVDGTEFYQLPRDVDKISIIRQTTSPVRLRYLPDDVFYRYEPNPTEEGNPLYYRIWEEEGVSTVLAVADTITVVSSSSSDTSSFKVSIVGYNASGYLQSEELSLNGTTTVNGALTYVADKPIRISKSAKTTGYITVKEASGATTLVVLGPEERSPRFKKIGLYPIPSSAITIYLEYYTRLRQLVNDSDTPDMDEKWIWVVRLGAIAKVLQYQGKPDYDKAQALYAAGVRSMIKADMQNPDYIPMLTKHNKGYSGVINLTDNASGSFYGEGLGIIF